MAPSEINFLIFASTWTIVSLAFLIIVPWKLAHTAVGNQRVLVVAEVLTMIFWFAGFVALAVFLSDRLCFGQVCAVAKAVSFGFQRLFLTFSALTLWVSRLWSLHRSSGCSSPSPPC